MTGNAQPALPQADDSMRMRPPAWQYAAQQRVGRGRCGARPARGARRRPAVRQLAWSPHMRPGTARHWAPGPTRLRVTRAPGHHAIIILFSQKSESAFIASIRMRLICNPEVCLFCKIWCMLQVHTTDWRCRYGAAHSDKVIRPWFVPVANLTSRVQTPTSAAHDVGMQGLPSGHGRALRAASTLANTSVKSPAASAGKPASSSAASFAAACGPSSASGISTARRGALIPLKPCQPGRGHVKEGGVHWKLRERLCQS